MITKQFLLFFLAAMIVQAQPLQNKQAFTKQDSLRGSNNQFRDWWDVQLYDINIEPNYQNKSIKGSVTIHATITKAHQQAMLQIDLQQPMQIDSIAFAANDINTKNQPIPTSNWQRDGNVYFVDLSNHLTQQTIHQEFSLTVHYSGKPKQAENPPWDGGWVFTKDQEGRAWMSVACQGLGASVWFPNKDYLGDEPNKGAKLSIKVPKNLVAIANGKLQELTENKDTNTYKWQVSNPINNYNIIPYIGYYVNFNDIYKGKKGNLDLNYWVLDYHLDQAKNHFQQTHSMLKSFEHWFGPYPFYEDSFKLVESPYLGMEHQSNIAYGNQYKNGYLGGDLSNSGYGLHWDFIIVHEAGHEWFGNSISANDIADLWVHEGFTHYSEVLHTQELFGKKAGDLYAQGLMNNIKNDMPIIGKYGVNQEGSGDMYAKGAAMIHTLRQLIENDKTFREMLVGMNQTFYHQTVTTKQIEDFISDYTNKDLTAFFNQYLRSTMVPTLELQQHNNQLRYRYTNIVKGFDMPLQLQNGQWIYPNQQWKTYKGKLNAKSFKVDKNFYVHQK